MLEVSNDSVAESATDYRHFRRGTGVTYRAGNVSKCCRMSSSYRDCVYQPPTSGCSPPSRRQHMPMPQSPQGMNPHTNISKYQIGQCNTRRGDPVHPTGSCSFWPLQQALTTQREGVTLLPVRYWKALQC